MFKKMGLIKKIYMAAGSVLFILGAVAVFVFASVVHLRSSSDEYVTYSNHEKFLIEKEVDHLKWVNKLKDLFIKKKFHKSLDR